MFFKLFLKIRDQWKYAGQLLMVALRWYGYTISFCTNEFNSSFALVNINSGI